MSSNAMSRHLLEEVKLYSSSAERESYDLQADVYAILTTLQQLERAYIRGIVPADEYERECETMIKRFRTSLNALPPELNYIKSDIDSFARKYNLSCSAALHRVKVGTPATRELKDTADTSTQALAVAKIVEAALTLRDNLELGMRSADELFQSVQEFDQALVDLPVPDSFSPAKVIHQWREKISNMNATETISDDDARQLSHNVEQAHTEVIALLKRK